MAREKKYNISISPLWKRDSGNFVGLKINDEIFDLLQGIERGGMLMVKVLRDESRKDENSPHGYLEYMSPAQIAEFKAQGQGPSRDYKSTTGAGKGDGF